MKKILIIAECFAPYNNIAAIRLTKLAKYFKLNANYNVTVLSKDLKNSLIIDPILQENLKYVNTHIIVENSKKILRLIDFKSKLIEKRRIKKNKISDQVQSFSTENIIGEENKTNKNILSFIKKSIKKRSKLYKLFLLPIKVLVFIKICILLQFDKTVLTDYKNAALKKIKYNLKDYDVVLSTFGPKASHLIALEIKKNNPGILWMADFRDPVIRNYKIDETYIKCYKNYMKKISDKSDIIIGVTESCIKEFKTFSHKLIYVICNGFDKDDMKNITLNKSNKFSLTYTGKLYSGKQDLSIVFKALSELIIENKIDKNNIIINYAGNGEIEFKKQIEKYNLLDLVKFHGFIDRLKSLKLQVNSCMLLLASWNTTEETHVVTGKFLEYMMMDKPIICSIAGNIANSQLKEMITEANNGVIWEEANNEIDYPLLKTYILKQYEHFMRNESLIFEPNMEYINQFSYKNIAQQFINLVENNEKRK